MKTIGLIGGMSWESSLEYYRWLNQAVRSRMGAHHSANILMHSVDFEEIRGMQISGDWERAGQTLSMSARNLEKIGAEVIAVCTNTMHKVAPQIQRDIKIPLLHIADAVSEACLKSGKKRVGLLGTLFTMEDPFYSQRLSESGLEVLIPEKSERMYIHRTIFEELCQGRLLSESEAEYLKIIDSLARQGADAVILGCTEIGLLVKSDRTSVPLFDTTRCHVDAIVSYALGPR